MPSLRIDRPAEQARLRLALGAVVVLALAATLSGLGNGFAYDDVVIIEDNPIIHSLGNAGVFFVTGYWPHELGGALYRPLTSLGFAFQWVAGSGSPLVFHAANLLLHLAVVLLLFRIARRCLPWGAAWIAAALFAVHPVHVEAVANAVGQAELAAALWVCLGMVLYLDARRRATLRARESLALFILTLAAGLTKENGVVLPVLLGAVELTLVQDPRPWRERARVLGPTAVLLVLAVGIALVARHGALGVLIGEVPAIALSGLSPVDRVLTALGIVPQYFRLLLWPAHLSSVYGPPDLNAAHQFGGAQALGLLLILAALSLAVACRRRLPAVTFGVIWTAIALLPVSNLLVPTGILLAERTLFLPSIGAMIAVGGLLGVMLERTAGRPRLGALARAALVLVLLAGTVQSALRQPVWRDNASIILQTLRDAPRDYRAWHYYGNYLFGQHRTADAQAALEHAVGLYQGDARVYSDLGRVRREADGCGAAVPLFRRAVSLDPSDLKPRGRLYVCLMELGDTARALEVAREGVALGHPYFQIVLLREGATGSGSQSPSSQP